MVRPCFVILLVFAYIAALSLGALAALWSAVAYFRRDFRDGPVVPMSVIKPIRGPEEGLAENLEALIEADREKALEILLVLESAEDPAYPTAAMVAARHAGRDIRVVLSGPSGNRMGKAHNMIEGFKRARHPIVIFSDADVLADRGVLVETSRAFQAGADAACAPPDGTGRKGFTDTIIGLCFNHFFAGYLPLLRRLGLAWPFAGGWMAFRRDLLDRMGGLERFSRCAADDYSLGLAARRSGASLALLPRLVRVREGGGTFPELVRHLLKWAKVVRFTLPVPYALAPLKSPVLLSSLLVLLAWRNGWELFGPLALAAWTALLRSAGAWLQDRFTAADRFPFWAYPALPVADLASMLFWFGALFSRTLSWRGKRYRLHYGGRVEALPG